MKRYDWEYNGEGGHDCVESEYGEWVKFEDIKPQWISVKDRLPEEFQPVVCIDVNRFENTGGTDFERNRQFCAYVVDFQGSKHWSVYGESGYVIDAVTHWMPLPEPPKVEG